MHDYIQAANAPQQLGQAANYPGNIGMAYPQPPQESGIVSTVKELLEAVNFTSGVANELQYSLGIAQPSPETNAKETSAPSLVQILRSAIYRVRNTNESLQATLRHINS